LNDTKIPQNIILFNSSSELITLKKLNLDKSSIIITFDFESHKLLLENDIEHHISDTFITEKNIEEIQKNSYHFTNWCNDKSILNFILHEEINLGNLFIGEFQLILVPLLKNFLEIVKIFQKFPHANYFSTLELVPFISIHTNNVKKIYSKPKIIIKTTPPMKYGLQLGGKHFTISLPHKYYKKIKLFSEFFLNYNFNSKINKNKKTVLLLEFSPTRFKHFFLNIPKSNINLVLHNRKFPSVWNFSSYSILKKSGCLVTSSNSLMEDSMKLSINKNTSFMISQIEKLWNQDSFFKNFFMFDQISFWPILKPFFKNLFSQKLSDYVYEIELTKKLFKTYNFSSILVTSENGFHEQIAINMAKKFGVKVALIQHGLYEDTLEAYEFNKTRVLPNLSDKFLVWGEVLKKYCIDCGLSPEKIVPIGNPAYDDFLLQLKNSIHNNSYILLTTSPLQLDTINDLTIKSHLQREEAIKKICHTITKLNKKLIIKLHPSPDDVDITNFVEKINPEIIVIKSANVLELIKNCEIFITLNMSTTILEAQISNKPTISLFVTERGFGISKIFESNSCISVIDSDFEKIFSRLLNDESFKNNLIHNGTQFSQKYLSNQQSSSKHLLSFLESF
jgi:hypothetical protein